MGFNLIYGNAATLVDYYMLNQLGFEFVVEDGNVTEVVVTK